MKLIDVTQSKCVGCTLCEMVCSLSHEGECSSSKARITIYRDEEFGNNLVSVCMQCADTYCVKSCRDNALARDEVTGAVLVDEKACTGCRACITACPVGGMHFDEARNVAFKCDLCGGDPECVKFCSREALTLVDTGITAPERKAFMTDTGKLVRQLRNDKNKGKPMDEVFGVTGG